MSKNVQYEAYGIWKVTTEGDCEGRSTSHLGTFEGFIDEIALALADKCCYSLTFKWIDPKEIDMSPKKDEVHIQLDIDSGTWDMTKEKRNSYIVNMLSRAGRSGKVNVVDSNYYASAKLTKYTPLTPEQKMMAKLKKAGFDPAEVIRTFRQR